MKKLFLSIIILNISCSICYSQIFDTYKDSTNFLFTNFENNVNNALLRTNLKINKQLSKLYLLLSGNYASDVSKLNENFAKEMSDVDMSVNYSIKKNTGIGLGFHTKNLSDNRNTELNRNRYDFLYANLDYYPMAGIIFNSKAGFKSDEQIGETTKGFSGSILGEAHDLYIQDYIANARMNIMYEDLNPKVNHNYEIDASLAKKFSENSQNYGELKAYNSNYSFYIPATPSIITEFNVNNNIQSRSENLFSVQDRLNYIFTKALIATITGLYSTRNVNLEYNYKSNTSSLLIDNIYDTKMSENIFGASGKLEFKYKNLFSSASLAYSERSETHNLINSDALNPAQIRDIEKVENNKNNNSRFTTLFLEIQYKLSNTNYFKFYNTSSILRYDTESKENFDDRDEAAFIYSVSHVYDNLRNFMIETTFDVNISNTKYILKEKSANNNTNKIYKLTSRSYYAPLPNLVTKNQFQVLANYTVYDFEDVISQIQSFSFRQLNIRDSVDYQITKRIGAEILSDIRLYEQGEFRQKEFSERPIMYYDEKKVSSQISYLFYDFLNLSFGYRYFIQKQFEFDNGEKFLKRTIKSYGPYARLTVNLNRKSSINIVASRDITSSNLSSFSNNSDNLYIYVMWYL